MILAILFTVVTGVVLAALIVEWRRLERVRAQRAQLARRRAMAPVGMVRVQRDMARAFAQVSVTFRDDFTPAMRKAAAEVGKLGASIDEYRRRTPCRVGDRYVPRHRA